MAAAPNQSGLGNAGSAVQTHQEQESTGQETLNNIAVAGADQVFGSSRLAASLRKAVNQVNREAQDFFLLSGESQFRLKERRRAVLSRRYALKGHSRGAVDAPSLQRSNLDSSSVGLPTKPPVLKLALDGISTLKRKTQSVIGKEVERGYTVSEHPRVALHSLCRSEGVHEQQPFLFQLTREEAVLTCGAGVSRLSNLIDESQRAGDEPDTASPVRASEKNWIWARHSVPENLKKQRKPLSIKVVGARLKKFLKPQNVNVIEYRPIFTYYVTVAQLLILIFSLSIYGFGPWGFTRERREDLVMVTSLTLESVDMEEPQNVWWGNREADLIHLGARFTPCMRDDPGIRAEIVRDVVRERNTACCVRHDRSGCVQTQKNQCSPSYEENSPSVSSSAHSGFLHLHSLNAKQENLSTWHRVKKHHGSLVGSVCGQDPYYCIEPASIEPYPWPDDFTKWPKCRKQHTPSSLRNGDLRMNSNAHMECQVVGRPCCIGTYGQCEITTHEHCDFVRGTFHEEAALCSQVSCLSDVCGMFPFVRSSDRPDQIYRLLTSLFLHAGVLHFALTFVLQVRWMRDLEKIYGPHRIGTIYMLSGVAGNLASAIFVPYRADVGPSAALFGIMGIFIAELVHLWPELEDRRRAIAHAVIPVIVGIVCGFTPWTDNFGHLFGLIVGFLLATMPQAGLPVLGCGYNSQGQTGLSTPGGSYSSALRRWLATFLILVGLFATLLVWFYCFPDVQCTFCHYFTCLPQLFGEACESHTVNYKPRVKIHF